MKTTPDRRLNAYRPDLAEAALRGVVDAKRYVEGSPASISVPAAALRPRPDAGCSIDTEVIFGETAQVFERAAGWAWVKADLDGYVGYLPEECLTEQSAPASER